MKLEGTPIPHQVRQSARADLDLYVNKIIGDEPHLARVRDISPTGVFLYRLLEPQARQAPQIGLEIQLPTTNEVIWALGEVVREEGSDRGEGVAVRFVRIAEHDRQLIREYVANTRPRKSPRRQAA